MTQGSLISTRFVSSWIKCECGALFALRFRPFDYFLYPKLVKVAEASVALDVAEHKAEHVNEKVKEGIYGAN